jgi:DNA-binding XRE family transcriptional regulator
MSKSSYLNAHERLQFMRLLVENIKPPHHSAYYCATYEEIGKELGISKQAAEQVEKEGMFKYREEFKRRYLSRKFDTEIGFGKTNMDGAR